MKNPNININRIKNKLELKRTLKTIKNKIKINEASLNKKDVLIISITLIASSFLLLNENPVNALLHSIAFGLLLIAITKGIKELRNEKEKNEKEKKVIDFLFYCSIIGKGKTLTEIIKKTQEKEFGLLGKEFSIVLNQTSKGLSIKKALVNMKKRNKSKVISRTVNLLILGFDSGADLSNVFRQTAMDLMQTKQIIKERNTSLLIQKYTLILAATIILPLILAMITQMISYFDFSALTELLKNMNIFERKKLIETAILAINIYLIEFAFLTAGFLALTENKKSKIFLNGSIYAVIAIMLFNLIKGIKLI